MTKPPPSLFDEIKAFHALRGDDRVRRMKGADEWIDRHADDPVAAKQAMRQMAPKDHRPQPGDFVIAMLYRGKLRWPDNQISTCHDCQQPIEVQAGLPFWLVKLCVFCAALRANPQ